MLQQEGPSELARLRTFYSGCQGLTSEAQLMLDSAETAMIFHVLVFDDAAAQAQAMFGGGGSAPAPPLDPLHPHPPPPPALPAPPPPGGAGGAVAAEEFQAICTKADLAVCAPQCNALTHGYLLSIEIDGRGTVMTCTKYDGMFSWQGQASLGGYIGSDSNAFLSAVLSHAAGTFLCTIDEAEVSTATAVDLITGQDATLTGGSSTLWTFQGEGAAFIIGAQASLDLRTMSVAASSGLAFQIDAGASLLTTAVQLPAATSPLISCTELGRAMGMEGLTCDELSTAGSGSIAVGGPIFISTSGIGFGMGSTKYMGDDVRAFKVAVS